MIPIKDNTLVTKIGNPTKERLKGRVGYIRLVNKGKLDITIITAYLPVEGLDPVLTGDIWDWIGEVTAKYGGYSQIIIGTDANAHVGLGHMSQEEMRVVPQEAKTSTGMDAECSKRSPNTT